MLSRKLIDWRDARRRQRRSRTYTLFLKFLATSNSLLAGNWSLKYGALQQLCEIWNAWRSVCIRNRNASEGGYIIVFLAYHTEFDFIYLLGASLFLGKSGFLAAYVSNRMSRACYYAFFVHWYLLLQKNRAELHKLYAWLCVSWFCGLW